MFTTLLLSATVLSWFLVICLSKIKSLNADLSYIFLMFGFAIPLTTILFFDFLRILNGLLTSKSILQHRHTRLEILTSAYRYDLVKMSWLAQELLFLSKLLNTPYQSRKTLADEHRKVLQRKIENFYNGSNKDPYGNCDDLTLNMLCQQVLEKLDQISKDY